MIGDKAQSQGQPINPETRKLIEKEVEDLLFTKGFNWNKTELARKYKTTDVTIRKIVSEITDRAKYIDYEGMQVMRLEKNRQLLLEELNSLRSKDKPRSHILTALKDTEREIRDTRIKYGFTENKEVINLNNSGEIKININIPKEVEELMRKNGTN